MLEILNGITASDGIAFGKAYKLADPDLSFNEYTVLDAPLELERLHEAVLTSRQELDQIRFNVEMNQGEEHAAIFDAQIMALMDPHFIGEIETMIRRHKINAEAALRTVADKFMHTFSTLQDEYMRERAADLDDVTKRILSHLLGKPLPSLSLIMEDAIIIATELTPSLTAQINKKYIKGFVTDSGGSTSHAAIIARSLNIPAIVGTKKGSHSVADDDYIIIDAMKGTVFINPKAEIAQNYISKHVLLQLKNATLQKIKNDATITKDGHPLKLSANINTPQDITYSLENGAEGVGLFRTEVLYMQNNDLPSEDAQFAAYKSVLLQMKNKTVTVRTLDIGGDKMLPYLDFPEEKNPFLGLRAIRFSLQETDIFRTQIRALLRASQYGKLKIMFPMISTMDEWYEAKEIFLEEKQKLQENGIYISDDIQLGMMIETPATAILAHNFAKVVDFFSIGTNDLIQYTFAADRMNENIAYLYEPYHPAILKLIKNVIDAAHMEGKNASICGEMAGDPHVIPILAGLGLDEFSMSSASILQARNTLKHLNQLDMKELADNALALNSGGEVKELVEHFINRH